MRTTNFWWFQLAFWSIAGTALFISGVSQMPVLQAMVRNLFLFAAGFVSSFFLAYVIDELRWMNLLRLRISVYAIAYAVALFCVVVINAITFTLREIALADLSPGQWFSGALNLALICAFWSELFIQRIDGPVKAGGHAQSSSRNMIVNHRGKLIPIPLDDILCIAAAGDYVEIRTADRTYLDRNSLHHMADTLGHEAFPRIHRSRIVNRQHVESITPLSKGRYTLNLSDGSTLTASRGYKEVVESLFLAGVA